MWLQQISEIGLVAKMDVKGLDAALEWYRNKLGFVPDDRFRTKTWAQLNLPGVKGAAVGLNLEPRRAGSGGVVLTLVVADVAQARDELIAEGVQVGPIESVGDGVQLAIFRDPDGNSLGLRENAPAQPRPAQIGAQTAAVGR
jgi:lactoylglutathione lyase